MLKLMPIFIFGLIMAALSERYSTYEVGSFGEKRYIHREKLFFGVMVASMAVFVGLRIGYNDTATYRGGYEALHLTDSLIGGMNWQLGSNPGFQLTNRIFISLGISTQGFLMIYAIITNGVYLWFVRKYTEDMWLSFFLFFTMGCYTFTMAAIKQTVAVAFCLVGTDRAIEKKWVSFVLWVLLASTFHPYALLYLIALILGFRPWTGKTYLMITVFGIAGVSLQAMLGTIVNITSMIGEEFDGNSLTGEGVNVFRLLVVCAPVILSFLVRRHLMKSDDCASNLILNFSMLNAEIMFIALFGTANYFARLANYFLIFQTIALPQVLKYFNGSSKRFLRMMIIVCYLVYFYYESAIANGGFDVGFRSISILEYFKLIV